MVVIRPPTPDEFGIAQRMLSDAHLDPTTPLRIEHTLIAEADGQVVGVGQIKRHAGCQELGSLVVLPAYRRHGVGTQLIAALEAQAERPLYLTCLKAKEPYYARFSYQRIRYSEMPAYFRRRMPLYVLATLFGFRPRVMRKA